MAAEHVFGPSIRELYVLGNTLAVVLIAFIAGRKAILAGLSERASSVAKQLVETQEELILMKRELDSIKNESKNITSVQNKIITETELDANNLAKQIIIEANITAARIVAEAEQSSSNDLKAAGNLLKDIIVKETLSLAVETVKKEHLEKIHTKLVDSFLDQPAHAGVKS